MKRTSTLLALVLAAGSFTVPVTAQETKPEDRNAALRYATIAYSTDRDLFAKTGEVDMSKVGFDMATAPADFKAACDALKGDGSSVAGQLIETSKLRKCDFEIAWEQGIGAMLPHLGKMRADARLLRVDARRLAIEGDAEGAAERLATIIRMARHASGDHIMISSLVSAAMCNLAIEETEAALAASKLTPAAIEKIRVALGSLDQDDPFAMKAAIRGEQRWTLSWVKATFHGPDAGKQLVATGYLDMNEGPATNRSPVQVIALMNDNQLAAAVDLASPYYDRVIAMWNKPDAVEQLQALGKSIENGEYGPIAQILAPAASKARAAALKGETRIATFKEKLSSVK